MQLELDSIVTTEQRIASLIDQAENVLLGIEDDHERLMAARLFDALAGQMTACVEDDRPRVLEPVEVARALHLFPLVAAGGSYGE